MSLDRDIANLPKQLLPSGRAFRGGEGSNIDSLFTALAMSRLTAYEMSVGVLNTLIPDNSKFTEDDATDWERRFGLVSNGLVPLADREAAILRKMQSPGANPAKGHYLTIQKELQAAGFNVWVHENIFPLYPSGYEHVAPNSLYGNTNLIEPEYGELQYGGIQYGGYYDNIIANNIDQDTDSGFDVGDNFASTFFIGGQVLGTYANVLAVREVEFRQLILNLKQVQSIGYLFINYT